MTGVGGGTGQRRVLLPALFLALVGGSLDWLQKLPCRSISHWGREGGIFNATHACYTDPVGLAQRYRLPFGALPFRDYSLEYPAGTGYVVAALSKLATLVGGSPDQVVAHYWDATAIVLTLALFVVLLGVGTMAEAKLTAMVLVAAGPLMIAELGLNWDLLALAPAVLAVLAWHSGRSTWAGVLLGAGAAVKLFPLVLLLALFLVVRRAGGLRSLLGPAGWAVGVFIAVQIPGYVTSASFADDGAGSRVAPSALSALRQQGATAFVQALAPRRAGGVNASLRFYLLSVRRPADLDSTPHLLNTLVGRELLRGSLLSVFTVVVFAIVVLVGGRIMGAHHPSDGHRPLPAEPDRLAAACILVLIAFLVANKVWSPQYSLWLLPFVVVAGVAWWQTLVWQAVEVGTWIARTLYYQHLHDAATGISSRDYALVLVLRLVAVGTVLLLALRRVHDAGALTAGTSGASGHPRGHPRSGSSAKAATPSAKETAGA